MPTPKRFLAAVAAGFLALGLSACDVDDEAMDDMDDPGLEEEGGDGL